MSETVNSPEVQKKIANRTRHENHLLKIDADITFYRERAAKTGNEHRFSEDMATVHSLESHREVYLRSVVGQKEPFEIGTVGLTVACAVFFFLGIIFSGIRF